MNQSLISRGHIKDTLHFPQRNNQNVRNTQPLEIKTIDHHFSGVSSSGSNIKPIWEYVSN